MFMTSAVVVDMQAPSAVSVIELIVPTSCNLRPFEVQAGIHASTTRAHRACLHVHLSRRLQDCMQQLITNL